MVSYFKKNRQAFNFYKSFDDVFNMLSEKQSGTLIKSILDVQFLRVHVDDIVFKDVMVSMAWAGMKQSVLKQVDGFCKANSIPYNTELFAPKANNQPTYEVNNQPTPKQEKGEVQVQGEEKEQGVLLPSTVDPLLWNDFLKLRTKLKAPNTPRALNTLKNKLNEFQSKGFNLNVIISTSYENGWKGLFEPKQQSNVQSFKKQDKQQFDKEFEQSSKYNIFDVIGEMDKIPKDIQGVICE
jgi:hypothetical protein